MNSSRRDFLLRSGLVSLGGTGLLVSACGGGGGGTGGGGNITEGLLNYGSQELPTRAYGTVPTIRTTSGSVTTTSNVTLPGVASVIGSKSTIVAGSSVTLSASLDIAKAVTFIATVPADITSRISYGIDVVVSSIQDSGKVHVVVDLPGEMQSLDPNTIVVGAHLIFDDSEGYVALDSAVSADRKTVAIDVPASVFDENSGRFLAHLVVAEIPVSRRPGTRPVDYSPNAQKLTVASDAPSGFSFASAPLDRSIQLVSRVGMREATATESFDRKPHVGVDLRADVDTKVLAVADGYLVRLIDFTKLRTGQGNFLSINHGNVASQYLHLASIDPGILAKIGGRPSGGVFVGGGPILVPIKAGDVLGVAGNTSTSRIDRHLHLNLVPYGSAWSDSRGLTYVYNPEPLLATHAATLDKPQLIAEFLFGYEGKKYQTHDDPNMFMDNPIDELVNVLVDSAGVAYLTLHSKDSVFRDVPLPSDSELQASSSNSAIATVSVNNGRVKIYAKKSGKVKIKVVYTGSAQKGKKAYGEVLVNIVGTPLVVVGTLKPDANGIRRSGLFLQSLEFSSDRTLLIPTTGKHYSVSINPENTKVLLVAELDSSTGFSSEKGCYVYDLLTGVTTQVLQVLDGWDYAGSFSLMADGLIGWTGRINGDVRTHGVYVSDISGTNIQTVENIENVSAMVVTPKGDEAMVYGSSEAFTGYRWVDKDGVFAGAGVTVTLKDPESSKEYIDFHSFDFTGLPIVLGTHHFIARSRTIESYSYSYGDGINNVKYSSEEYWEYTLNSKKTYESEIVCSTAEVTRPTLRICVSRDAKSMAMIGVQSSNLGAPDPTKLYIRSLSNNSIKETEAATGWESLDAIALMNL